MPPSLAHWIVLRWLFRIGYLGWAFVTFMMIIEMRLTIMMITLMLICQSFGQRRRGVVAIATAACSAEGRYAGGPLGGIIPKLVEGFADKIVVPTGKRDVLVFDSEVRGFGIRKYRDGSATYFVKYSVGGQTRRHSLGGAPRQPQKDARPCRGSEGTRQVGP
jgi:hypothetical protein